MKPLEVEFISHATLKIRGEFGTLLVDPWFLNEPVFNLSTWKFPPAVVPPNEVVDGVDYLFITHSHEDHFHIPSIDYIDRDVQVILPAYDYHPSLRAYTVERVMREMGFSNIHRVKSWDSFLLGGNTPLTVVPAADSRDQDWENAAIVLEHHDCTLLDINDNVNDVPLCEQIRERWPNIDLALIQSGGVTMFPGCFLMGEDEMREAAHRRKIAFREQRRLLEHVKPKRIAPFAGDFCWLADQYFHNNWANRTTPLLFEKMVKTEYPDTELVTLYPSDRWTVAGVERNNAGVDWDNMLDEMRAVKQRFQPKIDRIETWLHDVDLEDLKARSQLRCAVVQKWMTKDYIDFDCRFRIAVDGPNANFGFVMKANPEDGFAIDFDDDAPVTQTLHVPEHIWAAILEGKLMWNIIQWVGKADQHVEFNRDMGRFWFWLEYHIDLDTKNIQAIFDERLVPTVGKVIRPHYATFALDNEWK